MSFLGIWQINNLLTFPAITHRFDTGALTDADAVPAYRVYEDETGTAILTGNMAKLDDANTTGFYSEQLTLSSANGFDDGKCYTIYITAAVNSVTGGQHHTFQVGPVGANIVQDSVALASASDLAAVAAQISALNNISSAQVTAAVPTTAQITTAVLAGAVDGATTLAQSLALSNSALGGKLSGAGTGTETARDLADSKDRLVYTVDASGNRTAVTRTLT